MVMDRRVISHTYRYAYLRNPNPERSRKALRAWGSSRGSEAKAQAPNRRDRIDKVTTWRACLQKILKIKQVHRADQALLPAQVDSFVGCSLQCALHPPAEVNDKPIQKNPCDYKGHTHTPPRGDAKLRLGRMCKCARSKDKRMKT